LITALKKGEVDMLESVPADQLADVEANQLIDLYRFPSRRINFVAWNLANPLFENPVVREALARSVNRKEIIDALWAGFARECKGPVSPLLWAYDRSIRPIRFDPTEATRMFRTRGWRDSDGDGVLDKDGKPLAFDIIVNNNQLRIDVVTMVAAHLRRVGVKATIRVLEFSTYGDRLMKGNYEAAFVGIKNSTKMDITAYWHSSAAPPNGFNVFSYSNEDVDKWIDEAKVQLDVSRAERLWSKVQSKIYEDQPVMFLAVPDEVVALHARFCNVQPNALSFPVNLRGWRVEPNCER